MSNINNVHALIKKYFISKNKKATNNLILKCIVMLLLSIWILWELAKCDKQIWREEVLLEKWCQ